MKLLTIAALVTVCSVAHATSPKTPGFSRTPFTAVIDESGAAPTVNGVPLVSVANPTGVPVWLMPFPVTPGDLLLTEPGSDGHPGILSDVLRFWGDGDDIVDTEDNGHLTTLMSFFSDGEQDDSVVDWGLPADLQRNQFSLVEPQSEFVSYQAGAGIYNITSDGLPNPGHPTDTPEPATLALLAIGGLPLLLRRQRPV